VAVSITIVESNDRQLASMARAAGLTVSGTITADDLTSIERQSKIPDLLLIDVRGQAGLPIALAQLKRRLPALGVVIIANTLDPALMLEAMRAGVSELVPEPFTQHDLRAAVERVVGQQSGPSDQGNVFAFVGAKGGVGTTTIAVNVAVGMASEMSTGVLLTDLHVAVHGDAALLLGVEPRFSVVEAIENTQRLDAAFLKGLIVKAKGGLDVLASPERPQLRPPEGAQIRSLLERLVANYNAVVLDVPRSDFGVLDSLDPLTAVLLVVNQELPSIRRAAQIAALLRQRYGKDKVACVVSRYDARADIGQEDIERVVGLPVWAVLPSDYRKVIAAANAGKPLVSDANSRLASSVVQLARRLAGASAEPVKRPAARAAGRLGGLFSF
jgi:pilus assembly protein CpaE